MEIQGYVVASDVDGTLKHSGYIHPQAIELLERIRRYTTVAIVTGKRKESYAREQQLPCNVLALEMGVCFL